MEVIAEISVQSKDNRHTHTDTQKAESNKGSVTQTVDLVWDVCNEKWDSILPEVLVSVHVFIPWV